MPYSQNVQFRGVTPTDERSPDPPGHSLAKVLEEAVRAAGWSVSEIDIWRDSGWALYCRRDTAEVEVCFAQIDPDEWMLQVGPASQPGWIGRMRGRLPSASRNDLFELAEVLHSVLRVDFRDVRWCWDGFPDDEATTPAPMPWRVSNRDDP